LVGAGAVVTADVPDYAIVAGAPARRIGDVRDRKRAKSVMQRAAFQPETSDDAADPVNNTPPVTK